MAYCSCGEVSLYYESLGEGPPLLLIAGLGGGSWSWYGQVPYFENHYRTIIFDNRGAGRSSMPQGPYQMQQLAADARCLMDHLALEKAFVLGLSMGGMIAQELALMIPHRIQALFLGCTHAGGASVYTTSVGRHGNSAQQCRAHPGADHCQESAHLFQ